MAMDEELTGHVRAALADARAVAEVKMFGGIGFMLNGHMVAAASDRGLLVRVGKEGEAQALARPGASLMVMNGRTMSGYIRVAGGLDARSVESWLSLARAHVETLPAKSKVAKAKGRGTAAKAPAEPSKKSPARRRKP